MKMVFIQGILAFLIWATTWVISSSGFQRGVLTFLFLIYIEILIRRSNAV